MAARLLMLAMLAMLAASTGVAHSSPLGGRRWGAHHRHGYWANRVRCSKRPQLVCVLQPTDGNSVTGVVRFRAVRNHAYRWWRRNSKRCYVRITADVRSLTPGKHGIHAHAYGDERDSTGSSLGPHFPNPEFTPVDHGLPNDRVRHWGDFGNMLANKRGVAHLDYVDKVITINGIVGRGIIVHGGEDQGAAFQPSGASGPRVARCVIGYANPDL